MTARLAILAAGIAFSWSAVAEEDAEPDLDFLEYLGMWDESDEDWQWFDEQTLADNDERGDPVPKGEESTENEDES